MKRFISVFVSIILSVVLLYAEGFNFNMSVRDASGNFLENTNVKLRISIIADNVEGNASYIETFDTKTNAYGVASVMVGTGNVVQGDFNYLNWSKDMFLKSELERNGTYEEISTTQITAVPKALHSKVASSLVLTDERGNDWKVTIDEQGNVISKKISGGESPEYGTVDYIFDMDALPIITLEVSTDEWNTFLTNYDINPNNEDCIVADFTFNKFGEIHKLENVGLRLRGNTSRVRPEGRKGELHNPTKPDFHHCHFALRFAKYNKANIFSGTDRMNLKWFKDDAAYCREIYSYDMLRKFGVWTTPKSSYCRLQIKIKEDASVVYYGVYEMFEAIDDQYIADRTNEGNFDGITGYLWKMSWGSGVGAYLTADQANPSLMGISESTVAAGTTDFTYDYKSKKKNFDAASTDLLQFITDLNQKTGSDFESWAETHIDIDLLLKAYAVTTAVGQWDDYWGNGNNFYLYFDTNGKCRYIPYDFDNCLGTCVSNIVSNVGTQDPTRWGNDNRPLITKILAVERWRNQYVQYLKELASASHDYLDYDKSVARINSWYELISPYVKNDTGEDNEIRDAIAPWSSGVTTYKLFTGNENGGNDGKIPNFFKTRVKTINSMR